MSPHVTTMSAYHAQADVESASTSMWGFRIAAGGDPVGRTLSPRLNRSPDCSRTTLIDDLFWMDPGTDSTTALLQTPLAIPEEEYPIFVPFKPIAVRRLKGRIVRRTTLNPNPILPEA